MQRKIIEHLIKWNKTKKKKPLIIQGARQVGKTWLMQKFGEDFFKKKVYINFDNNTRMKILFEGDFDIERIIAALQIETGVKIDAKETLVIFDEIQEAPKAIQALKYFYEQMPELSIIAAGSLLGVAHHSGISFPVGKVELLDMYPMSFTEFLLAMNENDLYALVIKKDFEMIKIFKEKYITLLKQYYYIGGMPDAILTFIETKDYSQVRKVQTDLVALYEKDFSKHITPGVTERARMVWRAIPSQLAKENKKFIYNQIKTGTRAKDYENAIQWLIDSGLVIKVSRVKKPALPLSAYEDLSAFKLYIHDVGLLSAMAGISAKTLIDGNELFTEFKGSLTEQYVLTQLLADLNLKPYYYATKNSEIDYLVDIDNKIVPIEVKSSENLKAKSLKAFCDKYNPKKAIRTSLSDYREERFMVNVPLYTIATILE